MCRNIQNDIVVLIYILKVNKLMKPKKDRELSLKLLFIY